MNTSNTWRTGGDVYTRVTSQIIAELEKGVRPWVKPWKAEHPAGRITRPLRYNGEPYRSINILLLWCEAMEKGYSAPLWMTYLQAQEFNAHVLRGEHGSMVVFADRFTKTERDETGQDVERQIPFLKAYTVFNVEQIDGLPERFYATPVNPLPEASRIEVVDRFMKATGASIRHGGNEAYYAPTPDHIQLPPFEAFRDAESYCATGLHELIHWTRHASRLDRDFGRQKFGDAGYAREELVAELGAAFLCADFGIAAEVRDDHAAYLGYWLKVLTEDKRAIFQAAAHAQRACEFLQHLQAPERAVP